MASLKVSVVMPVYNEAGTVEEIISRVLAVPVDKEIIVVDDGSTDGTRELLKKISQSQENLKVFYHDRNKGKGAALRTGFEFASGDIVIIQDADLELDPKEFQKLLEPMLNGRADVVFGSRFLEKPLRDLLNLNFVGNKFVTLLSNVMNGLNLTDMETCYKAFKRQILKGIVLKSNRFGFEPEFTAKIAKKKFRICEVPISYGRRSYSKGKKFNWRDRIETIFSIFWFRFFD